MWVPVEELDRHALVEDLLTSCTGAALYAEGKSFTGTTPLTPTAQPAAPSRWVLRGPGGPTRARNPQSLGLPVSQAGKRPGRPPTDPAKVHPARGGSSLEPEPGLT